MVLGACDRPTRADKARGNDARSNTPIPASSTVGIATEGEIVNSVPSRTAA